MDFALSSFWYRMLPVRFEASEGTEKNCVGLRLSLQRRDGAFATHTLSIPTCRVEYRMKVKR